MTHKAVGHDRRAPCASANAAAVTRFANSGRTPEASRCSCSPRRKTISSRTGATIKTNPKAQGNEATAARPSSATPHATGAVDADAGAASGWPAPRQATGDAFSGLCMLAVCAKSFGALRTAMSAFVTRSGRRWIDKLAEREPTGDPAQKRYETPKA